MGGITVWHKYTPFISPHIRTLKTNDFYFNKYIPGFLTVGGDAVTAYATPEDAKLKTGKSYRLKSIYKKMYVKWNNGSEDNILKINYDGKTIYYNDTDGAIQPYNSFRDGNAIDSPFSPHSKSKIYLKHGNHIYNGTRWYKVSNYKDGLLIHQAYMYKNGHWNKL